MTETINDPIPRIDLNSGVFTANGRVYRIEGGLTIERYAELQILEKELAYGSSLKGLHQNIADAYQLLNKSKPADSAVKLHDVMKGIAKAAEREPTILKICALFINFDGEDRKVLDPDVNQQKINDWKAEGLDIRDFFPLASNAVNGFLELYLKATRDTSATMQKK